MTNTAVTDGMLTAAYLAWWFTRACTWLLQHTEHMETHP